ncbi:MAG: hypothetical protein RLZZ416_116 [Candidatus Parcubacteria bacterium]|jgi:glycosyltransferase involved in cell wall biosynthesis
MRIVIATGIFPPEIGGPAYYAANLKESLEKLGHSVDVVLYGGLKKLPSGVRHFLYACRLLAHSFRADAIIAFDTYTVGLPAALVHLLTRKPLVARIGGDFVWELYVERTHDLLPLPHLYERRERWNWKEKLSFAASRFVLRHARVAFSSEWLLDIWRDAYKLDPSRIGVVENAIGERIESIAPERKNFAFFTRQIALKNIKIFNRAFAAAKVIQPDIVLEEGTLPHTELLERMRRCYAVVLPSVSEVTPNYIIDAIRCGKPFLLTKYSGYAGPFGSYGVIVDPLDEKDMTRGILELSDPNRYADLCSRISEFKDVRTYDDVAKDMLALIAPSSLSR